MDWCWSWNYNTLATWYAELTDSLEKTLMLGKIEGRRRRGWQSMRWLDGITASINISSVQFSRSVQFSSVAQSCPTLCDPMNCSTPGLQSCPTLCDPMNRSMPGHPVHHQLPEFTQTQHPSSRWCHPVGDVIQSSHPLSSPFPPAPNPSQNHSPNESTLCMRWPKYWSFSLSISPYNEYPGLVSFRIDWLDLLAVQGTLKNLLQHHSSEASIPRCSAFFP